MNADNRSKPYYFSFDTKSMPGFMIAHCVRFESHVIPVSDGQADTTKFTLLGADAEKDPRIKQLQSCAKKGTW